MKKYLFILALMSMCAFINAQEVSLSVVGLDGSQEVTTLQLESANYTQGTANSSTGSRRASSTSGNHYLITRNQDGHSSAIQTAIDKGRMFTKGQLIIKLPSGEKTTYTFGRFYLANYSSSVVQGQSATEEFQLIYESVEVNN